MCYESLSSPWGKETRPTSTTSSYHRVFSRARWSLDLVGLAVFDLIRPFLGQVVMLALDDTLARKRGLKMFGCGMHHDPLLSTRKTAVMNWGHRWVVLGVSVRFPFRDDRYFYFLILYHLKLVICTYCTI